MKRVDVVVAVRNEELAIPWFLGKIAELSLPAGVDLGVILVEDSSTDGTLPLLRRIVRDSSLVRYYSVTPGFGQGVAVMFGLRKSTADAIIMMDIDGGHPVEVIPVMIGLYLEGAKVVQCVRETLSNRRAYRRWGTSAYQLFGRIITGTDTEEQNIFYRLVTREIADRLLAQPRYWHYLRFPLPTAPGALVKVPIKAEDRTMGESKYGFWRLIGLATDGILSQTPTARLVVVVVVALSVPVLLFALDLWPLAMAALAALAFGAWRYRRLQRGDLLDVLRVVETGGVPELPVHAR